jgi:hypothetical protein
MGSVNDHSITKSPFWTPATQPQVVSELSKSHDEVLFLVGTPAMFVAMWHVSDFEAGLVGRCQTCFAADNRITAAYGQSGDPKCPNCYGTTFDGGIRARVVRPAIITDPNTETVPGQRGEYTTDQLSVETTSDFYLRTGDYMFLADGTRYKVNEMDTLVVRTGFAVTSQADSVGGVISQATLEDPSSVAYVIPPAPAAVTALLRSLTGTRHLPADLASMDYTPGPLLP